MHGQASLKAIDNTVTMKAKNFTKGRQFLRGKKRTFYGNISKDIDQVLIF